VAKRELQQRALALRKEGKSYMQIRELLDVSKGTLSIWLRDYPLSETRLRELRDWNERRIEKYRKTRQKTRERLLESIYKSEKTHILPLLKRDLFVGGLFLYWGEGSKSRMTELRMANTDPGVIKAFIKWLILLGIKRSKIKIRLYLYRDMNIREELLFWKNELSISPKQFLRPHIKKGLQRDITYKSGFKHGTCNAIVGDAMLSKQTLMGLQVLRDYFMRL